MKTTVILDKRKKTKQGYPVKIRLSERKNVKLISTGVYCQEDQFQDDTARPLKKTVINSAAKNEKIFHLLMKAEELAMKGLSGNEIIQQIERKNEKLYLCEYLTRHAENLSDGSKRTYDYSVRCISKYLGKDIELRDIDIYSLRKLQERMEKDGISTNSISIVMRNIRTIYNMAITEKMVGYENYPFRMFKIRSEVHEVDYLEKKDFKKIKDNLCSGAYENVAKDMFMLSFLLCGANLADIYRMKKEDGHAVFVRKKTEKKNKKEIRIKIQPEAEGIIRKYEGKDGFLLNLKDNYIYETLFDAVKKGMMKIKMKTGIRNLRFYSARYTWASVADKLGIDEKVIAKSLGHADRSIAGKHYIKYDYSRTDMANRQVIDYMFE